MKAHLNQLTTLLIPTLFSLAACGAERDRDPAVPNPGSGAAMIRDVRQLAGTTWAWHGHEWTPRTDPLTLETNLELISVYRVRRFDPSGRAFVGRDADTIDEEACAAPIPERCAAYAASADGASLTLGDQSYAASLDGGVLVLDGERWEPVAPIREAQLAGAYRLAGYYGYQSGVGPTVDGSSLTVGAGRFSAARAKGAAVMLAYEMWPDCGSGCELQGRYTVGEHTLVVTSDAGVTERFFAWVTADRLQLGDDWYSRR